MSWGGYQNGLIPFSALVQVEPGKWLQPAAAQQYLKMKADCKTATGLTFYMASNTNPRYNQQAYRQKNDPYLGSQQYFWDNRKAFGIVAAIPGTSNHGWALAVDITFPNPAVRNWYRANCTKYGWNNAGDNFGEDWHKEYVGSLVPAGGGTPIGEEEMADNWVDTSTYSGGKVHVGTVCMTTWPGTPPLVYTRTMKAGERATLLYEKYGPHKEVDHDTFEAIRAIFEATRGGNVGNPVGGATKADVDSAADRVIEAVPTAEQNGAAARGAIVK